MCSFNDVIVHLLCKYNRYTVALLLYSCTASTKGILIVVQLLCKYKKVALLLYSCTASTKGILIVVHCTAALQVQKVSLLLYSCTASTKGIRTVVQLHCKYCTLYNR